jgi:hypothetical protein
MSKNKDKTFYINEIGVLDWLKSNEPQKIRFNDRIEYKLDNKLHREDGPAVEYFDGVGDKFYIEGKKLSNDEWQNFRRTKLIDQML